MRQQYPVTLLSILVVPVVLFLWANTSDAQSLTVTLTGASLTNVDDAAGRWQHEGGGVFCASDNSHIANYALYRRVTTGGTDNQNTAMLTMTIFFLGRNPPQNLTLQGSHDFSSGRYIGSVSAASIPYTPVIGAAFVGNTATDQLTIRRLGQAGINPCP
jgi:hypothetical protein